MTKKHLENIMTVDDEISIHLTKATLFLSDLIRKEKNPKKCALYSGAMDFVSKSQECLNGVLLIEYPDLDDGPEPDPDPKPGMN